MYRIAAQSVELHQHTISPDFEEEAPRLIDLERTSNLDNQLLQISQENQGYVVRLVNHSIYNIQLF